MDERITALTPELFLSGPTELLVKTIADNLKLVPQFATLFGNRIDPYRRMDYSLRELPALRVYNNHYRKHFESWFIEGEIILDVILPANIRRDFLQQAQDTIASALLQQFRRTSFFQIVEAQVPGLNELGKTFEANKELGFEWGDTAVPLLQLRANFRVDLRIWDDFFMPSDGRAKDSPFERTLENLNLINSVFAGLGDSGDTLTTLASEQTIP